MSYYVIDFNDKTEGLYTLFKHNGDLSTFIKNGQPIPKHLMYTTEPDLEGFASIIPAQFKNQYLNFELALVKSGKLSIEAVKTTKHLIRVGEEWELRAQLKKVHDNCFEFSFSGGERLYVSEFGLGEPDE